MRTITVTRVSSFIGSGIGYEVDFDGQKVDMVYNGKSVSFPVDERPHTLTVRDLPNLLKKASQTHQASVQIPGGDMGYVFTMKPKFGGQISIQQTDVVQGSPSGMQYTPQVQYGPINELDAYKPGGAQYYYPTEDDVKSMSRAEIDAFLVGKTLGTILGYGCLDIDGEQVHKMEKNCGFPLRSSKVTFSIQEGICKHEMTFYQNENFTNMFVSAPSEDTFDYMMSTNTEERHCLAQTHDLNLIRRFVLVEIAKICPNAWMQNGILYSHRP